MKIVFVITGLSTGGAETMLLKLLQGLDPAISTHVISLTTLGEIGPRIQALGIPVEALGMSAKLPNPLALYVLTRRLRSLNPDLVHSWMYHADLLGGLAARAACVRAVAWCIRNSDLDPASSKLTTRLIAKTCALVSRWIPDRIVVCSEVAKRLHVDLGYSSERMTVVPNGFDLTRFQPDYQARRRVRAELGVNDSTPVVGLIGRYDPQKNHAGFLKAAKLLLARIPSVHFILAGKGVDSDNSELSHAIRSAGLGRATHVLGLRSDMPDLMASMDVLALASSYGEAFPNVLGEAMASGVPCVVTDVGDSGYIVGDVGKVVPVGDMDGLADAIQTLLATPVHLREGNAAKARSRVAEHFEITSVVKRYEMIYQALCTRDAAR